MAQLIGPGDIIINSWSNFRKNLKPYAEFVVWFAVLAVLQWALWALTRSLVLDKGLRNMIFLFMSLPTAAVVIALTGGMIDLTARSLLKKKFDLRESMGLGVHRLLPLVWVSFLTTVVTITGLALFIIPGILFFFWFKFAPYFTMVDDIRGTGALAASRRLVNGRWWAVFLRIAVPSLFFYVATRFVMALAYLLIGAVMGDPGLFFGKVASLDDLSNTHTLVTSVVPQVIQGFALPLFLGADLILWLDLKKTPA